MASVTAPYCVSQDVAYMLPFQRGYTGSDFDANSKPTKTVVDALINQVASRIDMAYASAGYVIPFDAISGETWPTSQTEFLKYLNAVGVAAYLGGNAPTPPATGPGRSRSSGSLYRDEWETLMMEVRKLARADYEPSIALLRADTRTATPAEWRLSTAQPMTTDYLEGYYDPTKYDLMHSFTERVNEFYGDMSLVAPASPDYFWLMHQRLGYTYEA